MRQTKVAVLSWLIISVPLTLICIWWVWVSLTGVRALLTIILVTECGHRLVTILHRASHERMKEEVWQSVMRAVRQHAADLSNSSSDATEPHDKTH